MNGLTANRPIHCIDGYGCFMFDPEAVDIRQLCAPDLWPKFSQLCAIIETDAAGEDDLGWGAKLKHHTILSLHGPWTRKERKFHITWKESNTTRVALMSKTFKPHQAGERA